MASGIGRDINKLTGNQAKNELARIVEKLDELDGDDYFGTEGWRHYMGFED
jgi:hypothetical protein